MRKLKAVVIMSIFLLVIGMISYGDITVTPKVRDGGPETIKSATRKRTYMYIDGEKVNIDGYVIDGCNYLKIRDIGKGIGFSVGWDDNKKIVCIDTSKEYKE